MNCGILDAMEQNKNIISLEESNIDNNVSPVQIIFDTTFNKNANNQGWDNKCKEIESALSKIIKIYRPKKIKKLNGINGNAHFLSKKRNINNDIDGIDINKEYNIQEIANKIGTDEQFIRNITGIQQNVISYNDLIKKFCVKNKDGKYVLYRDIMNSLYNCNTLENYKLSYEEVYNTFKECLIRPEVSVKNIIDFIKNDEDNHNLFQRAEAHFNLSKNEIMHIYKTLGIVKDEEGEYESNCELIKWLESGNHYACRTEDHNILVRDKIARCIRYNDILVDDVLNYLDDPNHTIENAAIDLNKFEEDIRSIYYKYGIVKSENNKYYSCSGIIKNSCEILEEAKEKYGLPLETLDRIFRCNTIKNKQGRVIFLNEVFNYLDKNPNATFQNVAEYFNVDKAKIMECYENCGIINIPNKQNSYYLCSDIIDFVIKNNVSKAAKKYNLPIEMINRIVCFCMLNVYKEVRDDSNATIGDVLNDMNNQNNTINSVSKKYEISNGLLSEIYIHYGITKDNNGKYHCNSDILDFTFNSNGGVSEAARKYNLPIEMINRIVCCYRLNSCDDFHGDSNVTIGDFLNDINDQNNTINSVSKKYKISSKLVSTIYVEYGITKDNSGKYHLNSDILNAIKKNGSIKNTMRQEKFKNIQIERLNKIARCIDFKTDNSNYVAVASNIQTRELLIDDILNYLGNNPNDEMIKNASEHFWMKRKNIKDIYSKFGITKDNSGIWHCNN